MGNCACASQRMFCSSREAASQHSPKGVSHADACDASLKALCEGMREGVRKVRSSVNAQCACERACAWQRARPHGACEGTRACVFRTSAWLTARPPRPSSASSNCA
eukprot:4341160-Pleurochrysis_carterae.AAC.2